MKGSMLYDVWASDDDRMLESVKVAYNHDDVDIADFKSINDCKGEVVGYILELWESEHEDCPVLRFDTYNSLGLFITDYKNEMFEIPKDVRDYLNLCAEELMEVFE